jgi:hypothetical protein
MYRGGLYGTRHRRNGRSALACRFVQQAVRPQPGNGLHHLAVLRVDLLRNELEAGSVFVKVANDPA